MEGNSINASNVVDKYKNEFLRYLKEHGGKLRKLFDSTESKYSYFETQLIETLSTSLPEFIKKMSESRGISPNIHAFCVEDEFVNAFCFVVDKRYYIGIHTGVFVEIIRRTGLLANKLKDSHQWQFYKDKSETELIAQLWLYSFQMVLSHEYMHIILGHCDVICENQAFLWETAPLENETLAKFTEKEYQALEMFADEFAAINMAGQILSKVDKDVDEIKYALLNYYLAVLLVFSIFHNYQPGTSTHPSLGIRMHSVILTVDDVIKKWLLLNKLDFDVEKIDGMISSFVEIVQQFPELFSFEILEDLSLLEADKGYIELFNIAADIVKITNKKAIYPIEEFKKMDGNELEQLNAERLILQYAFQAGLSYDEACKLLPKT